MPKPVNLISRCFAGAGLLALSACLFDEPSREPTIEGRFGNRLEGLPPRALLDSSYLALSLMRGLSGDSYEYQMGYHSLIGGGGAHWRVTFRAGVPVREEYVGAGADGKEFHKVETPGDWSAPESAGGTELPPPVPLDSIYAECRILLDGCAGPASPFFAYDYNYILSACGCRDPAIADGVPSVILQRLRWASE